MSASSGRAKKKKRRTWEGVSQPIPQKKKDEQRKNGEKGRGCSLKGGEIEPAEMWEGNEQKGAFIRPRR